MNMFKTLTFILAAGATVDTFAADFSFDRPGSGFGTGITPVGQLAWEQGLPSATYNETSVEGVKEKTVTLNEDMLLRTGLTKDLELQLGWQGPAWYQTKRAGKKIHDNGLGDITIGLKKAIDLDDDRLSMAILAQALIATGNDEFTEHDDIYSLSSAVAYQYSDLIETSITMKYEVQNSDWAVTAIPTIGYKLSGKWSGYSEFVYRKAESQDYEYGLGTGVIYAINDRAQLDASVGVGLNGNDKNYNGGFGFSYLF
ncbi:transporter [Acinetobacter sp. S40]|uniref:transporter n=1 Tax=unclassified Acinetobacter TaxID=196816 RepID=UPI00190BEEF4|nr:MULTISPECIES: transporter [unclassified Acinetobacter]MBJ9983935.1 transporter [Acinetobacter sp. S40]MBK0063532.1 transporter [Acinetobacter sp. S55]MBK0065397.1 transporter [Acinetobacter sp. S54]